MTRHLGAARPQREVESLQELEKWDGLSRLDRIVRGLGQQPNVFRLLRCVIRDESVHSDMIGWLLDPQGWHGLGDAFSSRFIRKALDLSRWKVEGSIQVEAVSREFSTGNGPVDIFVRCRARDTNIALGIENKVDSAEGENQLPRYCDGLKAMFPKDKVVLAFLTLYETTPTEPDCPLACIGYDHLDECP